MKVLNKRYDSIPKGAVFVGRPSKYGNPFRVNASTPREMAINLFRGYAEARLDGEPNWLEQLKGKDLVCWRSPLHCHADVLLQLANK